jgi:uncharacterized protein YceH (UPF0502 family)
MVLDEVAVRALGALIEKEITTPEYCPLSLNALTAACNQKSNREPVMELDEDPLRQTLHSLVEMGLVRQIAEGRVIRFEHRMQEVFNLGRQETAVLCVLLLRGPQTPGELRGRTERLYSFAELADVQSALQRLMQREPALAQALPRQPGTKETRYRHLLSGGAALCEPSASVVASSSIVNESARLALLEEQLQALQQEVATLRQQLAELRQTQAGSPS